MICFCECILIVFESPEVLMDLQKHSKELKQTDVKSRGYYRAECEKLEYFKYFIIVLQLLQT